ncbi:hypothetical protein ACYSNM_12760 [Myroides sp. LJL116]
MYGVSCSLGLNEYSMNGYDTTVGAQVRIYRITPAGSRSSNLRRTKGNSGTKSFTIWILYVVGAGFNYLCD